MLDLDELKRLHDKSYQSNQITRERAADDIVFYWVTQWDDNLLGDSQLRYRGEFNIIRKAGRQIMGDLRSNPVQVDFDPKAASRKDGADILDGLYITDDQNNSSIEAYDNAKSEAVVCGVGAWELHTEYETNQIGDENQVIKRRPIYEANNKCFWDPNAKLLDKSDAKYVSVLSSYSEDGYKDLVKELTGEVIKGDVWASFKNPEQSYTFPWIAGQAKYIYVVTFYHKKKVKDKILTLVDEFGEPLMMRESALTDVMDELIDDGYTIESEKAIERWEVTKYIASGREILSSQVIAGENIPVVPTFGERAFVEDAEHYEGVTRLAKDPQRLRNFQMSYLADIVSRSPRQKPIFYPEQVQGFEDIFAENGADNNLPYMLVNRKAANGEELPPGPTGVMPEQKIPDALTESMHLSRQAVEDVANPGLPQDISDPDLSGKAVIALQNRLDQQSIVYQQNFKHAKRRDGVIYASMASEIYDANRKVTLTKQDGTKVDEEIMQSVQDKQTGEIVYLNDITNMEFDVTADIGPSYSSKKQETLDKLESMYEKIPPGDPMRDIIQLKILELMDGVNFDDIRKYARERLILMGIRDPETDEEKALLEQQADQQDQPDPNMVLAMAEMKKGEAAEMEVQRKAAADQYKAQNDQAKNQIDSFRAQTDRASMQVDAQEAGANIDFKRMQTLGAQIDNATKVSDAFRARLN